HQPPESDMTGLNANEFDSSDEEPSEKEETPFQVSWLALSPVYSQFLGICALPVAACLLLQLFDSVSPQQALDSLRDLRGPGAIQTIKQYNYLHDFREILATHMLTEGLIARSISR
uniref:protein-tyrosine-phosphatase n=1 Tax=Anolis carolinensis TaxID=28377 RepID=A0A803TPF7_ANOCA